MYRFHLANLPQSLKDQTTGIEQNRYHLEEIGLAEELASQRRLTVSEDCANTFKRYFYMDYGFVSSNCYAASSSRSGLLMTFTHAHVKSPVDYPTGF